MKKIFGLIVILMFVSSLMAAEFPMYSGRNPLEPITEVFQVYNGYGDNLSAGYAVERYLTPIDTFVVTLGVKSGTQYLFVGVVKDFCETDLLATVIIYGDVDIVCNTLGETTAAGFPIVMSSALDGSFDVLGADDWDATNSSDLTIQSEKRILGYTLESCDSGALNSIRAHIFKH